MRFSVHALLLAGGALAGCAARQPLPMVAPAVRLPLVGPVTRAEVEAALPPWRAEIAAAAPARAVVDDLGQIAPGGEVIVYLGTWCGDSRREVGRLWRALDMLGKTPPFSLRYVAVDRAKQAPGLPRDLDLRYVPTFVVRRQGREVGRVIESAPGGIEADLAALLSGARAGIISEREDLLSAP